MIRHIIKIGILCLAATVLFLCGPSALSSGGGGTDLPNTRTVLGTLTCPDGSPSSHTKVMLAPDYYNVITDSSQSLLLQDSTDNNGNYHFLVKDTGMYTLTAVQPENGTRSIITDILIQNDTVEVDTKAMSRPGSVKVTIPENLKSSNAYFYIPGTTIFVNLPQDSGTAILDSVPADIIPSVNYNEYNVSNETVIRFDVPVSPEKATTIFYPNLNHAQPIYFNTTESGAGVAETITNFPVLIRLSSDNFSFSSADQAGNDIRFANVNGSPLCFEIENWDFPNKSASIWVKIDTLYGNNNTQEIMMYWGSSTPLASESNSSAVFDTSIGFEGVWHFSEPRSSSLIDATYNKYNGTPSGSSAPGITQGIIGNAQAFDGYNYIEMAGTAASSLNFPEHGTYTISAWVNIDSLNGEYQMIASKGDKQYNLQFRGATKNWQFTEYQDTIGWDETVTAAVARTWVHLVGVRSGLKQYIYVNGICADSVIYTHPFSASDTTYAEKMGFRNTTCNFMVGKKVDYNSWFFKGSIDEVRVMSISPGADWIKLCYMNQKNVDMLVVYHK